MRRKVLKNTAFTLAYMFRGWQLVSDQETLARLGSGTLEIDILAGECRHNGKLITALGMATILRGFLADDLRRHHIPFEGIQEARLTVEMALERPEGQRTLSDVWPKQSRKFVRCLLTARSRLRTDELTYTGEYRDELEWPDTGAA